MAKTLEERVKKVLEDFADIEILYINKALRENKVAPSVFYKFLNENPDFKAEYEKIEHFNNLFKEDMIAEKAYREGNTNDQGVLGMMLKAKNKNKYETKAEVNHNHNFSNMSDSELNAEIQKLLKK